jgi:hypothetical protein
MKFTIGGKKFELLSFNQKVKQREHNLGSDVKEVKWITGKLKILQ